MTSPVADQRQLHVRFNGRSEELSMAALDLPAQATDEQIKQAVAGHLDCPNGTLDRHVVVRHADTVVVRPEALYG